jgi:hypothetical protein
MVGDTGGDVVGDTGGVNVGTSSGSWRGKLLGYDGLLVAMVMLLSSFVSTSGVYTLSGLSSSLPPFDKESG